MCCMSQRQNHSDRRHWHRTFLLLTQFTHRTVSSACSNSFMPCEQVVNVWGVVKSRERRRLILRQPLYGHTDTVTCLAASASFNIVVSGSRDRSCIVWDLCKLVFIRQLRGHAAPVAAVCVNDLTVRILLANRTI
jgi:WD40 repeat protein